MDNATRDVVDAPRVFLSHATEDKERFVLRFAHALMAKGVDVWLDHWEILPGDSLIDKIFEQGLKTASAVIVVLSKTSVGKPWVREELDAAAVKRINTGSKLIPVVLDECDVPQVLQSTAWQKVQDLNDIAETVDRVCAAIFDRPLKPRIGAPPVYSASSYRSLPGLSTADTYVLVEASRWTIEQDGHLIDPAKMFLQVDAPPIPAKFLLETIDYLEQHTYVKVSRHLGPGPYQFRVTRNGLELYLANHFPQYDLVVQRAIGLLVNEEMKRSESIASNLDVSHRVVKHILARLEDRGHLRLSRTLGTSSQVLLIQPSLRRLLQP